MCYCLKNNNNGITQDSILNGNILNKKKFFYALDNFPVLDSSTLYK